MLGVTTGTGTPPYTFSIISGALPPGLSLDPTTGSITGTPTTAGTFDFTWQVQDSTGATGTLMCEIIITTIITTPCDFITGGGFVFTDSGPQANFGSHGGCKNGEFWGHVNFVDHGGFAGAVPYHVDSTQITGYLEDDTTVPTGRDICGLARTNANAGETVSFRVHMEDNGEPGVNDKFGIRLSNGYLLTSRLLGNGGPGGGNIQLHKPNPSTTGPNPPPTELKMCGDMKGGILPPP
jgi:hypothetical protein